ncbi:MAG: hypothetical protein FJW26_05495 [Acidimicrobiia bacterium]|nr:hypothetical protein [Acidimicrobiia bacterium]
MNRILHIARKDFCHLYPGVAGCYGLILTAAALFTLAARGIAPVYLHPLALEIYSQLLATLYFIVSSVVLVRLVQADSLVSSTAFWLTRPISRPALLASKLLFAGSLLALAPALIEVATLVGNGLSLRNLTSHLFWILLRWLLLTLPMAALGSLSRSYVKFALLLVAGFASWFTMYFVVPRLCAERAYSD